ncbi:TNT domain-containing protein, partial [Actinopolyspora mortivallis]
QMCIRARPGAVPPPQARPMPPNAPGAPQPGQPHPAPVPPSAPNGQVPGGQPPGAPAAPPPRTAGDQPIQPLRGEPPLTLYRNRQTMMLQPGAELDRFGEPDGNVMYAIRTPYNQRSLPPQWASRNYFAYRVQRPVQVLGGTAVPWFEQPGGGTAYVLPASVNELLADGTLVALSGNEAARPPME